MPFQGPDATTRRLDGRWQPIDNSSQLLGNYMHSAAGLLPRSAKVCFIMYFSRQADRHDSSHERQRSHSRLAGFSLRLSALRPRLRSSHIRPAGCERNSWSSPDASQLPTVIRRGEACRPPRSPLVPAGRRNAHSFQPQTSGRSAQRHPTLP